ncbi:MAG TPA: hypothetical protein VIL74_03885 [Pyrinomonadaceae bacterium]|jgi:hypothetical protein
MQEQELFQGYELKNWDFNPRIYKILAVSALFNVFALLIVAQTNLLTTKGCDSPLVGGVCQVLDTLVVSGTALTTDTQMIDDPDAVSELGDAEIIWFDRTGDEDFKYPEGYFALSNPQDMTIPLEIPGAPNAFPIIPGSIPTPVPGGTTDLMSTPQQLPPSNPNAVTGGLPTSPFTIEGSPTNNPSINPTQPRTSRKNRILPYRTPKNNPTLSNDSPKTLDLGDNTAKTEKDPNKEIKNPTAPVDGVVINKAPLKAFAADVKTKVDKKEVDLSQNFKVVTEGVIDKENKLVINTDKKTKKPIFLAEGNEQMVQVVTTAIAAVGNSGWLGHLRSQGIDKINFTVVQDNDNLQVIIVSDLPSPERANTVTSGLNGAIQAAFLADKNGWKKLGEDEKVLLSSAKVVVNPENAKQFVLNFVLPKQAAQDMITRKLNEPQEDPTAPKKNGNTGQIRDDRQSAAK